MKINFLSSLLMKKLAKQLRKPSGWMAKKMSIKMNESNRFLYDFTLNEMHLSNNESILEIGFGNGKFFDEIFLKNPDLKVAGLDYSAEMVNAARNNNQCAINADKLTLRYGNSDKIPFAENSFDKVFCINVVYFWNAPEKHLREIHRVLKPGGRFYSVIRDKEAMLKMPFTRYGFIIYEKDEWETILENNNFSIHEVKKIIEPALKFDNKHFQHQSLCFIAEKRYEML